MSENTNVNETKNESNEKPSKIKRMLNYIGKHFSVRKIKGGWAVFWSKKW